MRDAVSCKGYPRSWVLPIGWGSRRTADTAGFEDICHCEIRPLLTEELCELPRLLIKWPITALICVVVVGFGAVMLR